jgi:hypothetical protein
VKFYVTLDLRVNFHQPFSLRAKRPYFPRCLFSPVSYHNDTCEVGHPCRFAARQELRPKWANSNCIACTRCPAFLWDAVPTAETHGQLESLPVRTEKDHSCAVAATEFEIYREHGCGAILFRRALLPPFSGQIFLLQGYSYSPLLHVDSYLFTDQFPRLRYGVNAKPTHLCPRPIYRIINHHY